MEKHIGKGTDINHETLIVNETTEDLFLDFVEVNSTAFTREISLDSARKILKYHGYRSIKYQLHQHLYEDYCDYYFRTLPITRVLFLLLILTSLNLPTMECLITE